MIISPQFDDVDGFYDDGYAVVKSDNKFGIINGNGEYIINPKYDALGL